MCTLQKNVHTHPSLKKHITEASCPQFEPEKSWQASLGDHPRLGQMAASSSWDDLWHDAPLLDQLRTHCVLCNQKAHSVKSLAEHHHRDHPTVWDSVQADLAPLMTQPFGNPCKACGQNGLRSHMCPVMKKLALIQALEAASMTAQEYMASSSPSLPCQLSTPTKKHKSSESRDLRTPKFEYHPARDSLDGLPQCAHCSRLTDTSHSSEAHRLQRV